MLFIIPKNMARFDMKNAYIVIALKNSKKAAFCENPREAFVHDFYNCDVNSYSTIVPAIRIITMS